MLPGCLIEIAPELRATAAIVVAAEPVTATSSLMIRNLVCLEPARYRSPIARTTFWRASVRIFFLVQHHLNPPLLGSRFGEATTSPGNNSSEAMRPVKVIVADQHRYQVGCCRLAVVERAHPQPLATRNLPALLWRRNG